MKNFKPIVFLFLTCFLFISDIISQETYVGADDKHTYLLGTKLLKNGDLVLIEYLSVCGNVNVKLKKSNGDQASIFTSGFSKFRSFNELPDNNWVLVLITNETVDTYEPDYLHTITFIEDTYNINSISQENITIPLDDIQFSAVIDSDQLVLATNNEVYFTDFEFAMTPSVSLGNDLQLMKSPRADDSFLYFKYLTEDSIKNTSDRFQTEQVIAFNLGPTFRDIHYLGNYTIIQNEEEISATDGLSGFEYLEQGTKIYAFGQQGQNLEYYTLSNDSIATFNKLYLDESGTLQKENFDIDVKGFNAIPNFYWDGNFKGISYNTIPLPRTMYDDLYQSHNYILDYNLESTDLTSQSLDVSIDTIHYEISYLSDHYVDLTFQITLSNKSDEEVKGMSIISNGFDGAECFDYCYFNKLDQISIPPNESIVIDGFHESFGFPEAANQFCLYAIGANNKSDLNFEDNIYCTTISKLTSTNDYRQVDDFEIFPNPAQNSIQVINHNQSALYHIYNAQGQLVSIWQKKANENQFDISDLSRGIYIIIDNQNKSKAKFMKI